MRSAGPAVTLTALALLLIGSAAQAQSGDVYWHIDPSVEDCSMVIDPSLTQAQWHRFIEQGGAVLSFKSLSSAVPLGRMNFSIALDYSSTPVDQHDPAWINTFTHPDEDCPLGDAIVIPTLRAGVGISDRLDAGGYWTSAPQANYGAVGGELKYAFLRGSEVRPAAAVRASIVVLTGVPDFDMHLYSVDLIASKRVSVLTPYVGVRESLVSGRETTSKVDLSRERLAITQGYVGVTGSLWLLDLAAEYNVGPVNTFSFIIGFGL